MPVTIRARTPGRPGAGPSRRRTHWSTRGRAAGSRSLGVFQPRSQDARPGAVSTDRTVPCRYRAVVSWTASSSANLPRRSGATVFTACPQASSGGYPRPTGYEEDAEPLRPSEGSLHRTGSGNLASATPVSNPLDWKKTAPSAGREKVPSKALTGIRPVPTFTSCEPVRRPAPDQSPTHIPSRLASTPSTEESNRFEQGATCEHR